MTTLVEKVVALHVTWREAGVPHAFGGALALAWCTQRARGTVDVDVNVLLPPADVDRVLASLPSDVVTGPEQVAQLRRDGQSRLWWDRTPVDLFLSTTPFHEQAAGRIRLHRFADHDVPFLGCSDLAVFKAFSARPRDWVDLEEMLTAGSLDAARVLGELALHLGADDERVVRLRALARAQETGRPDAG